MVETPLISVIITAYNVEKYIRQCIESLLAQTFTSIEFILVDDVINMHSSMREFR